MHPRQLPARLSRIGSHRKLSAGPALASARPWPSTPSGYASGSEWSRCSRFLRNRRSRVWLRHRLLPLAGFDRNVFQVSSPLLHSRCSKQGPQARTKFSTMKPRGALVPSSLLRLRQRTARHKKSYCRPAVRVVRSEFLRVFGRLAARPILARSDA